MVPAREVYGVGFGVGFGVIVIVVVLVVDRRVQFGVWADSG